MTEQVIGDLDFATKVERTEFGAGMVTVDEEKCQACILCTVICPAGLLVMEGEGKKKHSTVRPGQDNCMACACCEAICDSQAITVTLSYDHGGKWKQFDRGELSKPRIF